MDRYIQHSYICNRYNVVPRGKRQEEPEEGQLNVETGACNFTFGPKLVLYQGLQYGGSISRGTSQCVM